MGRREILKGIEERKRETNWANKIVDLLGDKKSKKLAKWGFVPKGFALGMPRWDPRNVGERIVMHMDWVTSFTVTKREIEVNGDAWDAINMLRFKVLMSLLDGICAMTEEKERLEDLIRTNTKRE